MGQAVKTYRQVDPTRTLTLRRRYATEMRKRFRHLRGVIRDAIIGKDVFGIAGGHEGVQGNVLSIHQSANVPPQAFDFPTVQGKVSGFMEWLERQVEEDMLEISSRRRIGDAINETWQNVFIEDSYKRGVIRSTYEMQRAGYPVTGIEERGGIQAVMNTPFHVDRLGVMYTRAFNRLKGITDAMGVQISEVLTQGLADGDGPRTIARKLTSTIGGRGATPGSLGITDTLGRFIPAQRRAEILARTEVIRAHHQGMMQTYRNWNAEGIKVKAELRTAGDDRVCVECEGLEGNIYTLDEAQNLIPVHPMCRCIAMPARPKDIEENERA